MPGPTFVVVTENVGLVPEKTVEGTLSFPAIKLGRTTVKRLLIQLLLSLLSVTLLFASEQFVTVCLPGVATQATDVKGFEIAVGDRAEISYPAPGKRPLNVFLHVLILSMQNTLLEGPAADPKFFVFAENVILFPSIRSAEAALMTRLIDTRSGCVGRGVGVTA